MEIKRLVDSSLVRSEEKLSDLTSVRQENADTFSNVQDSIESFAKSASSFENLTSRNLFAEATQVQTPPANSEIQNLAHQLEQLSQEKKAIVAQIMDLQKQLMAAEMAQVQSPSVENSQRLIELQKQLAQLKAQLTEVNVEIKQIMNQIEQKSAQEDATKDDIETRQDQEQNIMQNLEKAADAYAEILRATDILD